MEDIVGYVPPQAWNGLKTEQVPVIPKIRIQADPPGLSMKKHYGSRKCKAILTLLMEDRRSRVILRQGCRPSLSDLESIDQ